jgi:hypothetical protein
MHRESEPVSDRIHPLTDQEVTAKPRCVARDGNIDITVLQAEGQVGRVAAKGKALSGVRKERRSDMNMNLSGLNIWL